MLQNIEKYNSLFGMTFKDRRVYTDSRKYREYKDIISGGLEKCHKCDTICCLLCRHCDVYHENDECRKRTLENIHKSK
jgi:hypothetical protein